MAREGHTSLADFVREKRWVVKKPTKRKIQQGPLATPSGKVELNSTILKQLGYDPLPDYIAPEIPDEIRRQYPLTNISGGSRDALSPQRISPY